MFALALVVVVLAVGTVAWNCIDSLQKNTDKMQKYSEVPAVVTIKDAHMSEEFDKRIYAGQMDPTAAIQGALPKGSEIPFAKGMENIATKKFYDAAANFSEALVMVSVEANNQRLWHISGAEVDKRIYLGTIYEQRARCAWETSHYSEAISDLSAAIKLRPEYIANYQIRARIYEKLGQKSKAAADIKAGQSLAKKQAKPH